MAVGGKVGQATKLKGWFDDRFSEASFFLICD